MNTIRITNVEIINRRIQYDYELTGEWEKAFCLDRKLFVEYSVELANLPKSIAAIPLVANILPIAWLYDAEIIVDELDKDFFFSIEEFKKGYIGMYPMITFGGKVTVNQLVDNNNHNQNGVMAFFSGGVDAFNTLVQHAQEKPTLVTLWGADVKIDDDKGWEVVEQHIKDTSAEFEVDSIIVKSGLREFIDEGVLHVKVYKLCGDGWWHGFQHGIGIISHAAPVMYLLNKKTVYFASSFTLADKGKVTCASDPTIDNNIKFCGCNVVHDGYEFTRQMKIHNITQFADKTGKMIPLRVCWESTGGSNCCNCEKCWRTILGIYAEGYDPHDFGFDYDRKQLKHLARKIRYSGNKMLGSLRYAPIQNAMKKNITKKELPAEIRWFYSVNVDQLSDIPMYIKGYRKIKRIISRVR